MKISLVNADLLATACSVAFIKHGEGRMWGPERAIDLKLNGRLTSLYRDNESLDHIIINTEGTFPFPFLYIINFRQEDMPFNYSTVDTFARKIIRLAESDARITKIATTIHGPELGLDASESLETMLTAFASEIRARGISSNLEEIVVAEKLPRAFQRLEDRLNYLVKEGTILIRKGESVFLNLTTTKESIALEQDRFESLSLAPIFVAMPFAREFNNVYYFGIKSPVEQRKRKCERMDEDQFTGDIVTRLKERISAAELLIADTTGRNPNVFYEIGYAEGVSKRIILISQDQEIPFDLRTQRHILYDPQDIMTLADQIGKLLDALIQRS